MFESEHSIRRDMEGDVGGKLGNSFENTSGVTSHSITLSNVDPRHDEDWPEAGWLPFPPDIDDICSKTELSSFDYIWRNPPNFCTLWDEWAERPPDTSDENEAESP